MNEHQLEQLFTALLKRRGVQSIKLETPGSTGWPDRLYLTPNQPTFVEFKSSQGRLHPLQRLKLSLLKKQGYQVFIVSPKNYKKVLDIIFNKC